MGGGGHERTATSREWQGFPSCHQTQLYMHKTHTHSLCRSESGLGRPFQCLPNQPLLSIRPSKAWDPRSPHAVLLGFLGVLTSAFGAAKEKQGMEG